MPDKKIKVFVCGVLPPPYFGHSMLYEMLMRSSFPSVYEVKFFNMHFWSYTTNKKVTAGKLGKMAQYWCQYVWQIVSFRPKYILYNISFYQLPFPKDFLFCMTGILAGCRFILHDHGQYVRELYDTLPGWQKRLLGWMLQNSFAAIIMGQNVRPFYNGLMPQERLFIAPGTVEDTKDIPSDTGAPKAGGVNVLYFSYLSRDKGVFTAFEAVPLILKGRGDARVTFAGPLENDVVAAQLEALQKEFPGRVEYLGYIDKTCERAGIFRSADIFIFPTLRDVFGLVLLHAMAEGLPIVASREGTIPETIPDERHGLLFEKGNARALASQVLALLQDEGRRKLMGQANRRRFEEVYRLEKYGACMTRIFDRLERFQQDGSGDGC